MRLVLCQGINDHMSNIFTNKASRQEESHWLSVSDLMAGLMVVFLFIAIALMRNAIIAADGMRNVAIAYKQAQVDIYNSLMEEFKGDLEEWDAKIDRNTLTFEFRSPDVLFQTGEITLSERYRNLLSDFFPRYMEVLEPYKGSISEIRIEGHTSSVWGKASPTEAYFRNMALSQGRTRSVLNYIYSLASVSHHRDWIKRNIAAVGLSSSKAIITNDGREDLLRSRRVSFRVITNADVRIRQILELDK